MGIKDDYKVQSIPREQVREWLKKKHYAKSQPSVLMKSYGLYNHLDILVGVCCYGKPANNNNNQLGKFDVLELERLVINSGLEKNVLSYFVSRTFLFLPNPVVLISYADEGMGHHGYIYQATNWIYTGKGGGTDYYIDRNGKQIHSRYMSYQRLSNPDKTRKELAELFKWQKVKGSFKFRYYYFIGNKQEKKEMMAALLEKYTIEPYPKGDNQRYDDSYKPSVQMKLF